MNNIETIFGAPGCGKTTYLVNLLSSLLKEYNPDKIAFVSFTKKGTNEGKNRVMENFFYGEEDLPYFRTIHSLAFKDLGISRYEMISKKNYKEFSKATGMNFVGYYTEDFANNDDQYLFYNSLLKNNPEVAERSVEYLDIHKASYIIKNFERYKKELGLFDFDDLIQEFIKKNTPLPVKVAIIDEAQDLTSLQWSFCKIAFRNCEKVYIAGDDDQAIYEWSGADVKQFLEMTKSSKVKILDKSYRLKTNILNFSTKVSNKISNRVKKNFDPVTLGGNIHFHKNLNEVYFNNEETYYLLSRNTYYLNRYKEYVRSMGLPYLYKNKESFSNVMMNAIRKYEYLRKNEPERIRKETILQGFIRKDLIGTPPWYQAFNLDKEELTYYRDIIKNKGYEEATKIHINTIHGVKGGEADNVVLFLDMTKRVYENYCDPLGYNSELRCLYVALTRAKKNLHIIYSKTTLGYDGELYE